MPHQFWAGTLLYSVLFSSHPPCSGFPLLSVYLSVWTAEADVRAVCERRALRFGRRLLVEGAAGFVSVDALTEQAEAARHDGRQPLFPL